MLVNYGYFSSIVHNPLYFRLFLEWFLEDTNNQNDGTETSASCSIFVKKKKWLEKWLKLFNPPGYKFFTKIIVPVLTSKIY